MDESEYNEFIAFKSKLNDNYGLAFWLSCTFGFIIGLCLVIIPHILLK